jgi:hypothetical protein
MAEKKRAYRLDDPSGFETAYKDLVTETADGYVVRLPSQGDRTVVVPSRDKAAFIAEAEVLCQMHTA